MIFLYGASGHAKVIVEILECKGHRDIMFIDDYSILSSMLGFQIISSEAYEKLEIIPNQLFISIGNNSIRKKIAAKYVNSNFINAIHPKSSVSSRSEIGFGTVLMSNVSVNSGVNIFNHCIINTNASVDHDCIIKDFVHLSPNVALAGNVTVEEGTHIGIGASVIQGINIGKWATIGAGAVIINDVPDYAVVVGNPGRVIKFNENKNDKK
jgi:sugar O-acyltransferase (sialic acid O-acetyltransferase NeuD family)